MARVVADRVRETSTTTGTGDITLAGAVTGFRAASAVCSVGDTFDYAAVGGAEWEVGVGTYSATNTLTRTTVRASSNAGAAVSFSAGTKDVFLTVSAYRLGTIGLPVRDARSSNTQLAAADNGDLIAGSGTFTQTFAAAATLGADWSVYFSNEGTGIVTLDPNGSETIDGRTSIIVYPGEGFLIQCDGTALRTVGRARVVLVHTGSISSAVAAYDIEAPFTDAELRRIEVEVEGLSHNGGTTQGISLRVKKGGSYLTAGYGGRAMLNAFSNINNATSFAILISSLIVASVDISARVVVHNLTTSGTGQLFDVTARQQGNNNGTTGFAYSVTGDVATTGAVQGIRFMAATDSLDAGNFQAWGYR